MKVIKLSALARSVSLALAGGLALNTLPVSAQLLDHGPADPVLLWPQWYRDNNGQAVGLCKSQAPSPNAAAGGASMCFPLVADPTGFVGNVGPEVFYNMVEYKQKLGAATAFNFRYLAALEASYIPGPAPVHGQETVFARVRIAFNFNDPALNGHYKVTHPFGVDEFDAVATAFNSVQGSQASVFFTNDVPLGVAGNFDAALGGMVGPFIQWDVLNPGESLTVGGAQFLGDPNYPHTFTGSPFVDANGNPQNYVKIEGPAAADIGNGPGVPLIITEMNVLGQRWTAPIASNLVVDQAVKARSNVTGKNSIDVWATSTPGHKLVLSGIGMPSMQMLEDLIEKGHYHGHIEYPVAQPVPAAVTVSDNTSVPIISADHQLVDGVEISQAEFDTNTGDIFIKARSTDEVSPLPHLIVENIPGVPSKAGVTPVISAEMTLDTCALPQFGSGAINGLEKCFHTALPTRIQPPKFIGVRSSAGGSHDDQLAMVTGNPQNITPAPIQGNLALSVNATGTTTLSMPANTLIVTQPSQGTIALVGGQYQFTPKAGGATPGPDSFKFVVQDPGGAVSAQAIANLTVAFTPTPPTANSDQFAARVSTGTTATTNFPRTLTVLANDVPATPDQQNQIPSTGAVVIATAPARGTATANTNGTITYRATSAGNDSFTYRVKNAAGQFSAPATVQMTNFPNGETVSFKKTPDFTSGRWSAITGTTLWFGPNLSQTAVNCYLAVSGGVTIANPLLIGSGIVDGTGTFQTPGNLATPVPTAPAQVRCTSSNGGTVLSPNITIK